MLHAAAAEKPTRGRVRAADSLTPRERDLAAKLVADRTCKEAAAELGLSARTAAHYVERLKLRFGKSTLHGLVAELLERGLVRGPSASDGS